MKRKALLCISMILALLMLFPSVVGAFGSVQVSSVTLSKSSITLNVGKTAALTAKVLPTNATNKNLTWSSSNTKVAKVSSKGVVTAITAGKATITAKSNNGKISTKCTVTVKVATLFAQPTTITFMVPSDATHPYDPKWALWAEIKKQTNANIKVQAFGATEYGDKVTLAIASNNKPDVVYLDTTFMQQLLSTSDKIPFVSVLSNLKYTPNFASWYNGNRSVADNTLRLFKSYDGKLYMYPMLWGEKWTNVIGFMYRKDIFKSSKLSVPTTYSQMYTVMKALKTKYPDSYPFSLRFPIQRSRSLERLAYQWHTGMDCYLKDDGKTWAYAPIEPNFKKMLDWLRKCYKDKLIPQDFCTMETIGWQQLMMDGKSFITVDYLARIDTFGNPARTKNPSYDLDLMLPPKGDVPDGKAVMLKTNYLNGGDMVVDGSNKLNAMKFVDWMYSPAGMAVTNWGTEGMTYRVKSDGTKQDIPYGKYYGRNSMGFNIGKDPLALVGSSSAECIAAHELQLKHITADLNPRWYMSFNKSESEVQLTYEQSIRSKTDEFMSKYITGTFTDSDYQQYLKDVKALSLDKYIGIFESAYKRYQ